MHLLVDCGPGVLAELTRRMPLADLDAVLISHLHPDHWLDLVMVRQALRHGPERGSRGPLPTYVGPGAEETLRLLGANFAVDGEDEYWGDEVSLRTFDPAEGLLNAGVGVTFARTVHYVPCWAMRFESAGKSIGYAADTGPSEAVVELMRGVDLLISEATLPLRAGHEADTGHMAPEDAGEMAAAAGAGRLVLTHYFAELGVDRLRVRAQETFGGPVEVARQGDCYDV